MRRAAKAPATGITTKDSSSGTAGRGTLLGLGRQLQPSQGTCPAGRGPCRRERARLYKHGSLGGPDDQELDSAGIGSQGQGKGRGGVGVPVAVRNEGRSAAEASCGQKRGQGGGRATAQTPRATWGRRQMAPGAARDWPPLSRSRGRAGKGRLGHRRWRRLLPVGTSGDRLGAPGQPPHPGGLGGRTGTDGTQAGAGRGRSGGDGRAGRGRDERLKG